MAKGRGLFIVLYGPEGVGKKSQAGILEEKLRGVGGLCRRVRYPVYTAGESGKKLNTLLHHKKDLLPEEEMQKLFAKNRAEFETTLTSWLNSGVTVIGENYKGTGMVWGSVRGITPEKMEEKNNMADKYGWVRVGGDAPVLVVANRIWAVVRPVVGMR